MRSVNGRSLPDMPNTSGMYLQMSPGGTYADTTSPAFNVNLAAAGKSPTLGKGSVGAHHSCERGVKYRDDRNRHERA